MDSAKQNLTNYIEKSNTCNLVFSIVVAILGYVSVYIKCDWFLCIMFGFIGYRILSRTLEINISFVKDICDNSDKKSSNLKPNDRVRLAIKSLIEEAILFAAMYCFLLAPEACYIQSLIGGLHSFTLDPFSSIHAVYACFFELVAVWQKVCSGILVTLCIAQYFSIKSK